MRYVIIGGSAAGMAATRAIRQVDEKGSIIVLTEEAQMPYFRPMLPLLISGKKKVSDMKLLDVGPYTAAHIDIRNSSRVEKIDTAGQTLTMQNGDKLPYDKLLIATGARPSIPPNIEGIETEGVFTLRFLQDAEGIAQKAKSVKRAILLGAGMVNLKAALALMEVGLEITLIEQEKEILPRLMELEAGAWIHKTLSTAGIRIMTGCTVTKILSHASKVEGILLDTGQELPCELVCIATGIQPNVEFLKGSGIKVDQGIVADNFLMSNVTNIFTAGDVTNTCDMITGERILTGQWTNAVEMGRYAGLNMVGRSTEYGGALSILNATQLVDIPFVSMGVVHTAGTDFETHVRSDSKNYYHKLVFSSDGLKLIGALFIGDISRSGLYRYLISESLPVLKIKQKIIDHSLHYGRIVRGR